MQKHREVLADGLKARLDQLFWPGTDNDPVTISTLEAEQGVNIVQRPELTKRDRAGTACSSAASLSASVDGSSHTHMSTLRTDISTLGKDIL